jgi:hypothetical protein
MIRCMVTERFAEPADVTLATPMGVVMDESGRHYTFTAGDLYRNMTTPDRLPVGATAYLHVDAAGACDGLSWCDVRERKESDCA